MSTRLLVTIVAAIALLATACSSSDSSDNRPAGPISQTETSMSAPDTPQVTTTNTPPGAIQKVEIRLQDAGLEAGSAEVPQRGALQVPANLDGTSPVVVLFHGAAADKQSVARMADAVAGMGIPVLNASWPFGVDDPARATAYVVCAVAHAYHNASSWGADPDRVIVMGHSGGGHLGMLAALAPEAFPECATASDAHVWAYIGLAGDPAAAAPGGNARRFFEHDPELLELMDTYSHIGGNTELIARFVHGTSDLTVPIQLTGAFHDALIAAGYDSELISVNGADHFDPANPTTEAGQAALNELAILAGSLDS